jgi:hypothetical protein
VVWREYSRAWYVITLHNGNHGKKKKLLNYLLLILYLHGMKEKKQNAVRALTFRTQGRKKEKKINNIDQASKMEKQQS